MPITVGSPAWLIVALPSIIVASPPPPLTIVSDSIASHVKQRHTLKQLKPESIAECVT